MTSIMRKKSALEEKMTFSIIFQQVLLKKVDKALEKEPISVLLERGSRSLHSGDKDVRILRNGDATIEFNETFSLDATMLQERGRYVEKIGKIILRKKKKGLMGSIFVELGSVQLPLHSLITEELPVAKTMLLEKCAYPGSQISISVDCSYSREVMIF
jgi:hypothetical protein